jgi:hypothetical protein
MTMQNEGAKILLGIIVYVDPPADPTPTGPTVSQASIIHNGRMVSNEILGDWRVSTLCWLLIIS